MKYRAEIDGLRAVAVIPVILFHAGFELFSGGFVGVDVFFVISGYLITTILIDDIENHHFSLVNFYERRARRILPALFFVILVCIPFAWMWMLPNQMKDFSKSLVAVSFFVSNILFFLESGYFEASAEEKPLLHTWSLAVEEQYYIFFPIFLFLACRFGKNRVFWMIVVMSAISLLMSEWGWRNKPSANFYLAPTRAWELFAGSIAAFIVQKRGVQKNELLSLLGLAAIVFSIFVYDETTPFPSVYALVPVVGVVLLVLFAQKETLVARVLSAKLFVGIGLISYSAYLWHQPLFAFARIKLIHEPNLVLMTILSILSLVLAIFSWKYIERPFRKSKNGLINRTLIFSFSSLGIFFLIAIGYSGYHSNGFGFRFTEQQLNLISSAVSSPFRSKCHFPQTESSLFATECEYFGENAEIVVFGNSHATELAYALAIVLEPNQVPIEHHTMSGCRHNFRVEGEQETICYRWHDIVVEKLKQNSTVKQVVVSYRNEEYLHEKKYRESLVKMISSITSAGKQVVLVLQAPLPDAHIDKYISKSILSNESDVIGMSLLDWNEVYSYKKDLSRELPDEVILVDPVNNFCISDSCYVIRDGEALYFDDDHMSIYGASLVAKEILSELK